jgi:RNA polymerase sigma factor for flagellar operon FliA
MTYAAVRKRALRDADEIDTLIHTHLQLVRRLAWHVHGRVSSAAELEELIQAGMVALVEAARAFEDRGFEFSTYASVRIKGAMIDHLRRGSGQSRGASSARRAIEAARRAVESTQAGPATAPDIAAHMGVPLDTYFRMESETRTGSLEPLDDVYADDNMTFSDDMQQTDDVLDRAAGETRLRDAIAMLDERSQLVLQLYFFEEMNLEEIGHVMDVGAARVCQIKKAALTKLRDGCGASDMFWALDG